MKPEVQDFLDNLTKEEIQDLKELLENKSHKKWVFSNVHYLLKGLVFLITTWIVFETFIKNLVIKLTN